MTLEELCYHLIPDNDDQWLGLQLLRDADLNARICSDEQLYLAYIKVLEEYVYTSTCSQLRQIMLTYWKEKKSEREPD